ncbi:hypothetical protein NDU88_002332 [Pleurodeles waltl]|uniref:Uncharacterized protein n=1 Tax=Pleurodeles waltl TaxID=8319 RepID=A0AAV7LC15_PLEWA|nr:hypothetical protein NDU88_002332 [Pleurodeles waltl]
MDTAGAMDQLKAQEAQLVDIQWKLKDQENRQRRNSLWVLRIPEGKEGTDVWSYLVELFRQAFPDLED